MRRLIAVLFILTAAVSGALGQTLGPAASTSTPGGSNGQLQINSSGSFGGITLAGDCTFATPNVTCLNTNGTPFGTAATQNTGTSGATVPLLNGTNTHSGAATFSAAGIANVPGLSVTGTPFAGTGTTSTPQFYINNGTAPTTFPTGGTYFGINGASGFVGNLFDVRLNGAASFFSIIQNGAVVLTNNLSTTAGNLTTSTGSLGVTGTSAGSSLFLRNGGTLITSPASATWQMGAADSGAPLGQVLQVQGSRAGTDSNVAGGGLTLKAGLGTGNSATTSILLQSPIAVASGTGAQTMTTGLKIQNGAAILTIWTVATLPTCGAGMGGAMAMVNDATAPAYNATVTGGGAVTIRVTCDGTNWKT